MFSGVIPQLSLIMGPCAGKRRAHECGRGWEEWAGQEMYECVLTFEL